MSPWIWSQECSTPRWFWRLTLSTLVTVALVVEGGWSASAAPLNEPLVRLPGHALDALQHAKPLPISPAADAEPLTLTITLSRADQAGFDRYLRDVYDEHSPRFRHFLSQRELTARFGPTQKAYDKVVAYLRHNGFTLAQGSANRLTVTVHGTWAQAKRAFHLGIGNYSFQNRTFYANDQNPGLPPGVAGKVAAVTGLSNLATVRTPLNVTTPAQVRGQCLSDAVYLIPYVGSAYGAFQWYNGQLAGNPNTYDQVLGLVSVVTLISSVLGNLVFYPAQAVLAVGECLGAYVSYARNNGGNLSGPFNLSSHARRRLTAHSSDATTASANQKIGLLELDTFHPSDVQDWLSLVQANPSFANQLSAVPVNGGVGTPGGGEAEVLLDIATVMEADPSPNTSYVVYDAPFGTSFQQLFNAMINDGDTVISNSWEQCEDQTSLADAQSIDSVLAQAAASGISVFNATGDYGAACFDGSPNTIGVPADSPHATAVGGTTPTFGPAFTYGTEAWWNNSTQVPPSGAGGYGVSKYFPLPSYQSRLTTAAGRSVPDVAVDADPTVGLSLCQGDAGGCPTGLLSGGTSMAAPFMAGMMAALNESVGSNLGQANPVFYPLAGTKAFNSVGSFVNVGLGSPNFFALVSALGGYQAGSVDPSISAAGGTVFPTAGGTPAIVRVNLADATNFPVVGKAVSLTPNGGSSAVVSAPSGPSGDNDGAVTFSVTDATPETVTFIVSDTTDGITLTTQPSITFLAPPATSGGINAFPTTVASDGSSTTTIIVTLQGANGNGAPGKTVTLSQGSGNSIITAPTPAVTNASGQIQFTATDNVAETVTYTAVDATDGLPVPGSGSVTFSGSTSSCAGSPPTPASGFTITPFATGFFPNNFYYSGANYGGCFGALETFDTSGDLWIADNANGNLYELGPGGGAATSANIVASPGLTLWRPVFGSDGSLYTSLSGTGSGTSSGEVIQIDPGTRAVIKTLASGLSTPGPLAVDPLSGDLFFTDECSGSCQSNSLWRITNPASATPGLTVYATLPYVTNGPIAFAPNGTLYVVSGYGINGSNGYIVQVGGTNTPAPPAVTTLPGIGSVFWLAVGSVQSNGAASSLILQSGGILQAVNITTSPFTSTPLAMSTEVLGPVIGPDGCVYAGGNTTVYKIAPTSGSCGFFPLVPAVSLSPVTVSPNPVQGTTTTFTATLSGVSQPQGTPITFAVSGANSVVQMVPANSNGVATFTYSGVYTGTDTVVSVATVGTQSARSNLGQVTWTGGTHTTFLTLNLSPTGGTVGTPVAVNGSLADVSVVPAVPLAGASITFTLGGQSCNAVTDSGGFGSCSLTPGAAGLSTLSAAFPGAAGYQGATASTAFSAAATLNGPFAAPTISKAFTPTAMSAGATTLLTFTLTNSNATSLTGGVFTDLLAGMSAVGGAVGGTCSGTAPPTLAAGQTALSFSAIAIPASGACTVSFGVSSNNPGSHTNIASGVTTTQTPTAGAPSNTATLTVYSACDINLDGSTTISDVQNIVNEALGRLAPLNDLNGDGVVNVVDVQIVIDAVLNLGCSAS